MVWVLIILAVLYGAICVLSYVQYWSELNWYLYDAWIVGSRPVGDDGGEGEPHEWEV